MPRSSSASRVVANTLAAAARMKVKQLDDVWDCSARNMRTY
jgi:hypothetical protein